MPHMGNMPWIQMYLLTFMTMFVLLTKMNTNSTNMVCQKSQQKQIYNKWQW